MNAAEVELLLKYKSRNLKDGLRYAADYTQYGYIGKATAEFYRWLSLAALRRIEKLEMELVEEQNNVD